MNPTLALVVVFSVVLSAGSQVILKKGVIAPRVQDTLASGDVPAILMAVLTSPMIVGGLICFGLNAFVWLYVLSKVPLSSAYPFVALGIGITVVAGLTLFDETVTTGGAIGVGLIILGILFVASQT